MTELPASEATQLALAYFQTPDHTFWHWADDGAVVEWRHPIPSATICYREELQAVLDAMVADSLPPLSAVLLLLAACADTWPPTAPSVALFRTIKQLQTDLATEQELLEYKATAIGFLQLVHELPRELRTGPAKLRLVQEVLLGGPAGDPTELADARPTSMPGRRLLALAEWTSGRLDMALRSFGPPLTPELLRDELYRFTQAQQRFPTTEALALLLRTGLTDLPQPLPELPTPLPEPEPTDLLDQLGEDPRTYGLALLTRRLTAALRIPLHTHAASEQPLGGVADISNRGSFDRLLLSELAQDDLMLLARLAGNEALYLRREAPPTPDVRPQVVLLDTTLRLWGVPRVFGLAAALAWTRQARQPKQPTPVAAYALGGNEATDLDLTSFDGVTQALTQLDVAPHAGPALLEFVHSPEAAGADCLLVTAAELLALPAFAAALAEVRPRLRYLLTVDRSGELQLYEYQGGQRQLLGTTRYDLDALLFAPMPARRGPRYPARPGEPAYLAQEPAPLFFPSASLKVSPKTAIYHPKLGLLGISEQQRVLFYPSREFGAQELRPCIEAGQYHFGHDDAATVYVLVHAGSQLFFYAFATDSGEVERAEVEEPRLLNQPLAAVNFLAGCFYLRFDRSPGQPIDVTVFDCHRRQVVVRHQGPFPAPATYGMNASRGQLKQHVNNGYSVLQNVHRMGLSPTGELALDGRALHLWHRTSDRSAHLKLRFLAPDEQAQHGVERDQPVNIFDNPQLWLGQFTWPDGSTAWVDSRGLLHLRSADARLPQVTVVLVVDQATAAWAADGTVCGPDYFTGLTPHRRLPAPQFYQQYLQPFIDQLLLQAQPQRQL